MNDAAKKLRPRFPDRRPKKQPPPPSIEAVDSALIELREELTEVICKTPAGKVSQALEKTFGSVGKGYGAVIALRNALRSARKG